MSKKRVDRKLVEQERREFEERLFREQSQVSQAVAAANALVRLQGK